MKLINIPIIVILITIAPSVYAEEEINKLFGLIPGNESPIPNSNDQAPFNLNRVPVKSAKLAHVFPDVQMFALKKSNIIIGFSGRRAYESLSQCETAKKQVLEVFKNILPKKYSGEYPRWEHLSNDGKIAMGIKCTNFVGNPYPVLEMEFAHIKSHEVYYEQLKQIR